MNRSNIGLVAFIERHDGCTVLQDNDATLLVQGIECLDGVAREYTETIDANKQAVRDWLGY